MRRPTAARRRAAKELIWLGLLLAAVVLIAGLIFRGGNEGKKIRTNDDRLGYLRALGWEAEAEPLSAQMIRLPKKFPEVLENYNQLQLQQGFDLTRYAGKKAELYIYRILNYTPQNPEKAEEIRCSLYIYKGKVIGGDIHSTAMTGFMSGLR